MGENKLPFSTMKRLLIGDSGLRSDGEAVTKFTEKLLAYAAEESKKAAAKTVERHRKTIGAEDVE